MNLETTDLEQLAQRWAQIKDHINALQEEEEEIKTKVSRLGVGTHPAGAWKIQVKAPRRVLDKKKLAEAFPLKDFPALYTMQLDPQAVEKHIEPDTRKKYYSKQYAPVVVLKAAK